MNPELLTGANHLSCRRGTELHPRERHGVDSSERKYGVKDTENEAPLKPCRCYVRKHVEVEDTIRPCLDLERETGSLRLLACEWRSPGMGYISSPGAWCDSDVAIYSVQNGVSQPQTATYRPTDSTSMTDHEDSGSPQAAHEAPDSLLTLRLSPAKSWALLTVSVSSSLPCPGTSPVSFPAASRSHPFSLLMVFSRPALGRAQEVGNRPVPSHQDAPWCCGEVMGISPSRLLEAQSEERNPVSPPA
ncbi:uncharacterized protein LOC103676264 isoform X1 [Ursus maritimus]|uniref:Uncharacterized protein LOC103676264 isoform X1 n=1 Tax=Ursus maritimus TaxID=29073 RepID=A0A8M1H573_URSMA|nr:uncharacterized protein LOC103676264 isoform X1 [Ursus maritimus]